MGDDPDDTRYDTLPGIEPGSSTAYVAAPVEPRPNPNTVEGYIAGMGLMASGAKRMPGRRGAMTRAMLVLLLALFVLPVAIDAVSLLARLW